MDSRTLMTLIKPSWCFPLYCGACLYPNTICYRQVLPETSNCCTAG